MLDMEGKSFKAILTTKGRNSGKDHSVELLAVQYQNKIFFSRRNQNSDWLKNANQNKNVKIEFEGKEFVGKAEVVEDKKLCERISQLKYSDIKRQKEPRIALQVTI